MNPAQVLNPGNAKKEHESLLGGRRAVKGGRAMFVEQAVDYIDTRI